MKRSLIMMITVLYCLATSSTSTAQIDSVRYLLKYNDTIERFEMHLIIKGNASSSNHRIQANTQITFVTPNGSNIQIVNNYEPRTSDTQPMFWFQQINLSPPNSNVSYTNVVATLSPTARYDTLVNNDTIKLFDFIVTPMVCKNNVRFFKNGIDPAPSHPDMNGLDFANGMTIGGPKQLFSSSTETNTPFLNPEVVYLPDICPDGTVQIQPSTGGIWKSNDTTIAKITGLGLITGIKSGTTKFTFNSDADGCISKVAPLGTVIQRPIVAYNGTDAVCIGQSTSVVPSTGGTWTSNNPDVASVSTLGSIVGVSPGTTSFVYTSNQTGCRSLPTEPLTVHQNPITAFSGPQTICVGQTTNVVPTSGGTWSSSNPAIAQISNNGSVTGVSQGTALLKYTFTPTGCTSDGLMVTILPKPIVSASKDSVNQNQQVSLSPSVGGIWISNNPDILEIVNGSYAKGLKIGTGSVYFQASSTGCRSSDLNIKVVTPMNTIVGYAFRDANGNGIYDANTDSPMPNCAINVQGINGTFYTDNTGYYYIAVPPGTYTATFKVPYGTWLNNIKTRNINASGTISYVFVGFDPVNQALSAVVSINSANFKCGTSVPFKIKALNTSSQILSGYLYFDYDARSTIASTNPFPAGSNDNQLIWSIQNIVPGNSYESTAVIDIPVPASSNDSLHFKARLMSLTGDTLSMFRYSDINTCENTTGKMLSWPDRGTQNFTLRNEPIDYIIRFENPAPTRINNVSIKSNLDQNVDVESILIKDASHPLVSYQMDGKLYFQFNNINLNGTRNETKNGYVTFQVRPKTTIPDGTLIYNNAEINFDNLATVTTEPVFNTIVSSIPSGPLPVRWISFDAKSKYGQSELTWTVQNQINVESYGIEHSKDGFDYALIGDIKATSDNQGLITYNFMHTDPAKEINYYRIKQKDFDGNFTYSDNRSIRFGSKESGLRVYPNPTKGQLILESEFDPAEEHHIHIINMQGEIVLTSGIGLNAIKNIDVTSIPDGTYIIKVITKASTACVKFVKM